MKMTALEQASLTRRSINDISVRPANKAQRDVFLRLRRKRDEIKEEARGGEAETRRRGRGWNLLRASEVF